MRRYWVIAPYYYDSANPDSFDAVWEHNLRHGIISIGWGEFGDITRLTHKQFLNKVSTPAVHKMLYVFSREVQSGDVVIARRGRKVIGGIEIVRSAAYYDPTKNPNAVNDAGLAYPNHLDVEWLPSYRNHSFPKIEFAMQTIYELPEERFRELVPNFVARQPRQPGSEPSQPPVATANTQPESGEPPKSPDSQKPVGRLQTIKQVLEVVSIAVGVIGAIVALIWRSK
jgi:hypothetical protein